MSVIIDLLVISFVALMVYLSAKKGLVRSLFESVGYFVSIALAFFGGKLLSGWLYSVAFRKSIEGSIENSLSSIQSSGAPTQTVTDVFSAVPKYIASLARFFGVTSHSTVENIGDSASIHAASTAQALANAVVKPVLVTIFSFIFFVLLFVVCRFLFRSVAAGANKVASAPVIGSFNMVLGGGLGLVKAFLFLLLVTTILGFYMNLSGSTFSNELKDTIASTALLRLFFQWNPLLHTAL